MYMYSKDHLKIYSKDSLNLGRDSDELTTKTFHFAWHVSTNNQEQTDVSVYCSDLKDFFVTCTSPQGPSVQGIFVRSIFLFSL